MEFNEALELMANTKFTITITKEQYGRSFKATATPYEGSAAIGQPDMFVSTTKTNLSEALSALAFEMTSERDNLSNCQPAVLNDHGKAKLIWLKECLGSREERDKDY